MTWKDFVSAFGRTFPYSRDILAARLSYWSKLSTLSNAMRHILIVDDAKEIVTLFQKSFEAQKFRVTVAQDGEAALTAIANDPIDGVVTDFRMPDMNGDELLLRIRERQPCVPAIIVSASANEVPAQGDNTVVLSKPVIPIHLVYQMIDMIIKVEDARGVNDTD